jgi:EF hand
LSLNRRQLTSRLLILPILVPTSALAQALVNEGNPPNTFISPCGQPFRAKRGAPYPVADWFHQVDKDNDGKIMRAEFNADAEAFFEVLDQNRDGFLSPHEVNYYELKIAPEVVGVQVEAGLGPMGAQGARLWLAQYGGPAGVVPDAQPDQPTPAKPDISMDQTEGASPYSFFDEPEPVAAADVHFRGIISKDDFITLSNAHFDTLDRAGRGYLNLDTLPKTPVQRKLERAERHHR